MHEDSVAPGFCDIFEKAPGTADPGYFDWLCGMIRKYEVEMAIPSIEIDMIAWSENRSAFEDTGCFPLLNNQKLIRLCSDKWLFYEELKKAQSVYAIPTTLEVDNLAFKYPVLLKPRRGYASKGIVIVENEESLSQYRIDIGSKLMVQPVIGKKEEEYTTSAFFDVNSQLCCFMTLKRLLSSEGFTEKARVTDLEGMEEALLELAKIFKPIGPTNFQFRMHNGVLKLLEINPRVSSATSIRTLFGYNESSMSVSYFLDQQTPEVPKTKKGYAIRYTEDMVFYENSSDL